MNIRRDNKCFGSWLSPLIVLLILAPLGAVTQAEEEVATAAEEKPAMAEIPAWIVATSPPLGAVGVDPDFTEITVTFNRAMSKGMSWTGGEPFFPPQPDAPKPLWKNDRTCALPVELNKGEFYRVGINSTSYRNFRSTEGEPAPCAVIYFSTQGATKAVESRVRVPQIVKMVPENGATDVDPTTKALRITFDVPMGEGMSWTGDGDAYPQSREGEKARWSSDGKTCTLPVQLEPGHDYQLGINSLHHINFQSKWGVPAEPVTYRFQTAGK